MQMKTMNSIMYSSFDRNKQPEFAFHLKDYGCVSKSVKKVKRKSSKWGSACSRYPVMEHLQSSPKKKKNKEKVKAIVSTSLYFHKKMQKKFKKEVVSKQPSYKNILDSQNSLNNFINLKGKNKPLANLKLNQHLKRNTSTTKISKIEYQVKRHCL